MSKHQDQNMRNTSIQWTQLPKYDAQQQLDELKAQRQQPTLRKPDTKILKPPFRDDNDELNHFNDTLLPFRVRLSVNGEEPVETTVAIKSDHIECPKTKHIAFDKLTEIRINTGNFEKEKYGEGSFTVIFKSHPFRFEAKDKEERDRILKAIRDRFPECNINETKNSETLQIAPEDDMMNTQKNELSHVSVQNEAITKTLLQKSDSDSNKLEYVTKHMIHEHNLRDRLREEIKEKLEKLKADTKAIEEKQQEISADAQQTRHHLDVERETFLRALSVYHSLNEHQIQEITLRISKDEEHRYSELERKHNELIEDEKQIQIGLESMRKQMELQRAELVDAQNQMDAERKQIVEQREILKAQQSRLENERMEFQKQKSIASNAIRKRLDMEREKLKNDLFSGLRKSQSKLERGREQIRKDAEELEFVRSRLNQRDIEMQQILRAERDKLKAQTAEYQQVIDLQKQRMEKERGMFQQRIQELAAAGNRCRAEMVQMRTKCEQTQQMRNDTEIFGMQTTLQDIQMSRQSDQSRQRKSSSPCKSAIRFTLRDRGLSRTLHRTGAFKTRKANVPQRNAERWRLNDERSFRLREHEESNDTNELIDGIEAEFQRDVTRERRKWRNIRIV